MDTKVAITGQDAGRVEAAGREMEVLAIQCDAGSSAETEAMMGRVGEAFDGRVDVLFVNAGILTAGMADTVTEADFARMFGVNVMGAFFTIQKAFDLLGAKSSVIVTTSMLGSLGTPGVGVYAASKAAARSMVRTFASELATWRIRVNAVAPGPVDTPAYGKTGLPADMLKGMSERLLAKVPMGRFGQPEETSGLMVFPASDESSFMTGGEFSVDGGWLGVGR